MCVCGALGDVHGLWREVVLLGGAAAHEGGGAVFSLCGCGGRDGRRWEGGVGVGGGGVGVLVGEGDAGDVGRLGLADGRALLLPVEEVAHGHGERGEGLKDRRWLLLKGSGERKGKGRGKGVMAASRSRNEDLLLRRGAGSSKAFMCSPQI